MTDRPRLASGIVDGERVDLLPLGVAWWASGELSLRPEQVTDLRPLYVLDLDSLRLVELLVSDLRKHGWGFLANDIAAQIPAPALPDEPGVGAVFDLCSSTAHIQRWGRAEGGWRRLTDGAGPRTWAELHKRGTVTVVAAGL